MHAFLDVGLTLERFAEGRRPRPRPCWRSGHENLAGHEEVGAAVPDVSAASTIRIASAASMPTLAITAA
jgi:hypothetical protein